MTDTPIHLAGNNAPVTEELEGQVWSVGQPAFAERLAGMHCRWSSGLPLCDSAAARA